MEGLREAIRNYEERHGLVKEREPTTAKVVRRRLKNVLNPLTGLDVVRTELVTDVTVEDGVVTIQVDLPSDHQFANNIREEIAEKIEPLWEVDRVEVLYRDQ